MNRTESRFLLGVAAYITAAVFVAIGAAVVAGWLIEAASRALS